MNGTRTFVIVALTAVGYACYAVGHRFTTVRRDRAELRRRANEWKWEQKRREADELAQRLLGVG